jgi:hypothetical protein
VPRLDSYDRLHHSGGQAEARHRRSEALFKDRGRDANGRIGVSNAQYRYIIE